MSKYINIDNEDVFQKAFGAAELANFTQEQKAEYEQSRMNYLGVKAVSDTAKEEKEIEIILKLHRKGKTANEISDLLDITVQEVAKVLNTHT